MVKNTSYTGKIDSNEIIGLGQQTWNIADGYTKIKILRLLILIDTYETISKFGYGEQEELVSPEIIPQKRIEGLQRVIFYLKQLIGNCKFALREHRDFKQIKEFEDRLAIVEKYENGSYTINYNYVTKDNLISINESHFNLCFDILRKIKDELNFPINASGLIFRQSDDVDLDKLINEIVEGG